MDRFSHSGPHREGSMARISGRSGTSSTPLCSATLVEYTWLIRNSRGAWSELKWRAEPVELFQINQHSTMVDLLHALDEFRRLLRTKFT
jgi:hypothetical protein